MGFVKKNYHYFLLGFFILIGIVSFVMKSNTSSSNSNHFVMKEDDASSFNMNDNNSDLIYVDVKGQVYNPGVYEIEYNSRVFEAIRVAGGLTKNADSDAVNLSEIITDGMVVYIPHIDEGCDIYYNNYINGTVNQEEEDEKEEEASIININTATNEQLQQLTGVGESIAAAIILYRTEHGDFVTKEDIKNVSGIGDVTYETIKDYITV